MGKVKVTYADGRTEFRKPGSFRKTPYGRSEQWRQKRRAALDRDDNQCLVCRRTEGDEDPRLRSGRSKLEVHHKTYERYGHEHLDDLATLCQRCHATEHQWLKRGHSQLA
jgi:5-methylcytosine-specific restriction endonuclease McrA